MKVEEVFELLVARKIELRMGRFDDGSIGFIVLPPEKMPTHLIDRTYEQSKSGMIAELRAVLKELSI